MSATWKRVVALLVARPLIAVAIAAVVGRILLLETHSQKTPVTHRTEHVRLTDEQQMQLGDRQYAKTLGPDRPRIVSSRPAYSEDEAAHATAEHVAERIEREYLTKVAAAIIAGGVEFTPIRAS